MGVFRKGNTRIKANNHGTDFLVIGSPSREGKGRLIAKEIGVNLSV